MSSPETLLYASKLRDAYNATHQAKEKWKAYETEFAMLKSTLNTLPDKVSHSVMVPIGKLAFMPGKLIHTNEITVLLGENWYAERSASQAVGIVERREEFVRNNLSAIEKDLQILKEKVGLTPTLLPNKESDVAVNEDGLPIMDIREDYPSDDEKSKTQTLESSRPPPSAQHTEKTTPLLPTHQKKKTEAEIAEYNEMMRIFTEFEEEEERALHRKSEGDTSAEEDAPRTDDEGDKDSDDQSDDGGEDDNEELAAEMELIREKMRVMSKSLTVIPGNSKSEQRSKDKKGKGPQKKVQIEESEGEEDVEESETEDVVPQESGPKPVQPLPSTTTKHLSFSPSVRKQSEIRSPADIFQQMSRSIHSQDDESTGNESEEEKIVGYVNWKDAMKTPQMAESPDKPSGESIVKAVRERDQAKQEPQPPTKSVMSFNLVEKETVKYADESDMEDDMLMREVAVEYQRRRQDFIAAQGGYSNEATDSRAENEYSSHVEGEEEEPPKKLSRFKAARLGFKPT